MPRSDKASELRKVPIEILMTYYEHQYSRMKQLEDQRINITNITITLSVLALTFGFHTATGFTRVVGYALLATMAVANLFAIVYIMKTRTWISTHRKRAKGILAVRSKALWQFDQTTHDEHIGRIPGRGKIQLYLHVFLLIVAILLAIFLALI